VPRARGAALIPTDTWVLPRPRKDAYVGSFPLHFEQRLWRLLGKPAKVLHPFGGLAEIGDFVDLNPTTAPTWVGDAHDLHFIPDDTYDLVVLDPPYSNEEAEMLYGTPKLRPGRFTAEAVRVCKPGGHVAVYHRAQPKRPPGTRLVRRIVVLTRTGHAPRVCFVFEKQTQQQFEVAA
jgi:SAM-dependent methyltransferase